MTRAERAAIIDRRLEQLFPNVPVPLEHVDPFTLLVAVVLSAQCTDVRVNQTTPLLFARASTPEQMRRLAVSEIQDIIRPCGLSPQKARAIRGLSEMICDRHGGRVPDDLDALQELPGVGRKTALVVMAQAFGHPSFPVDTHIHRLAQQWGLTDGRSVVQTERDLTRLFPRERWNRLHLQIIYYGRQICPARGCDGMRCEMCKTCFPKRRRPVRAKMA